MSCVLSTNCIFERFNCKIELRKFDLVCRVKLELICFIWEQSLICHVRTVASYYFNCICVFCMTGHIWLPFFSSATCYESLSHGAVTVSFHSCNVHTQRMRKEGMLKSLPLLIPFFHPQHRTHQIDFNQAIK